VDAGRGRLGRRRLVAAHAENLRRTVAVVPGATDTSPRTYRLPALAYFAVALLAVCVTPLVRNAAAAVVYLIPIAGIVFIRRTATVVDRSGILVRALAGQTFLQWNDIRGLFATGRSVYAVTGGGSLRLPCVRVADLSSIAAASGGRLPALPEATPKSAPGRRRR
jgi:Bacterial PH domain